MKVVANGAGGCMRISGQRATPRGLVPFLQGQVDHPIIDETGLTGEYDFRLEFAKTSAAGIDCEIGASLFSPLRDQLGLSLREEKVPMDVIVIDHAERDPKPN